MILLLTAASSKAQLPKNSFNVYVGLIEVNFNYERNVLQMERAFGNLRLGVGRAGFLQAGEGNYINLAYAHIIGNKKSHIEADIGFKYMVTNSIDDPRFSEELIPDLFIGYRFQNQPRGIIFRAGINYPTIINLGIGLAF
jgi:hypothetical protein